MSFSIKVRVRNDPERYKKGEEPRGSLLLAMQDLLEGRDTMHALTWLQRNVNAFSGERNGQETG